MQRWGAARTAILGLPHGLQSPARPRVTTTPRRPEPAWHRRERAQRSQQRLLLRAVGAASALSQHHGTAMAPNGHRDQPKADWLCKSCKGRDDKPFRNFGHRAACHKCHVSKGSCFWKRVAPGPPRSGTTLAERQVLQQKIDEKYAQRIRQKDTELARLKERLRKQEEATAGSVAASSAQEEPKDGTDDDAEQLKEHVKMLGKIPGTEVVLAEKQALLEAALQRRRAAKPVRQQLRELQNKLDRREKNLEKRRDVDLPNLREAERAAKDAVAKAEEEIEEIEAGIIELRTERDRLQASEPAERTRDAAERPGSVDGEAFAAALGRLAVVVEALPRAYNAGNIETAYDGIMEHLQELTSLARNGSQAENGITSGDSGPMPSASIDSDDEFPEEYLGNRDDAAPEVELDDAQVEEGARTFPDVAGLDADARSQRVRAFMQDVVRRAKRTKRST